LIATNPGFPPGFFVGGKYMMKYIFESPDRGETVYKRRPGQTDRVLHYVSPSKKQDQESHERFLMWGKILLAAKTNPALNAVIEQAEMLYHLTRNND
jgi:hypothetical protein